VSLSPEIRRLLARYCRDKRSRRVARDLGARWDALRIDNAATGIPYGEPGAWALIADSLEDMAIAVHELMLDKPPGAKAHWWLVPQPGRASIYIKIQIGAGGCSVLGRSFHYSEFEEST
jgi:hypothetical protein